MKHKKSYYENGLYIDITTGKKYIPSKICVICGSNRNVSFHHYISQQRCINDLNSKKIIYPKTLSQEEINKKQKLFELCDICHNAVHNLTDEQFKSLFRLNREEFIYKC